MKISKRKYLDLCKKQPIEWLENCAAAPSAYMTKMHIALIRIAIRQIKKGSSDNENSNK